jgi:hypothetical protein
MSVQYPFESYSPSDPQAEKKGFKGLGFYTREAAEQHASCMSAMIATFDEDPMWNKEYWTQQPHPWIVVEK